MATMAWNVYGRTGHRQRASFGESYRLSGYDNSGRFSAIDLLAEDVTNSNDYAVMVITADTKELCLEKFIGQLSDGVFENCRVGKIEEITVEDLIGIYAESAQREWLRTWCEGCGEYGTLAFEIAESIYDFDPYCGCGIGYVFNGNLSMLNEGRFKETADDLRMLVDDDRSEEGEALLRIADEIELIPVADF